MQKASASTDYVLKNIKEGYIATSYSAIMDK